MISVFVNRDDKIAVSNEEDAQKTKYVNDLLDICWNEPKPKNMSVCDEYFGAANRQCDNYSYSYCNDRRFLEYVTARLEA
jgi:hypothetical protein